MSPMLPSLIRRATNNPSRKHYRRWMLSVGLASTIPVLTAATANGATPNAGVLSGSVRIYNTAFTARDYVPLRNAAGNNCKQLGHRFTDTMVTATITDGNTRVLYSGRLGVTEQGTDAGGTYAAWEDTSGTYSSFANCASLLNAGANSEVSSVSTSSVAPDATGASIPCNWGAGGTSSPAGLLTRKNATDVFISLPASTNATKNCTVVGGRNPGSYYVAVTVRFGRLIPDVTTQANGGITDATLTGDIE